MAIQVYGFWRSLATFRVRVALKLKGVAFEEIPIDILSGEQFQPGYAEVNAERRLADDLMGQEGICGMEATAPGIAE